MNYSCRLFKFLLALFLVLRPAVSFAQDEFSDWLQELRIEAMVSGVSDATANDVIRRIEFLPDVIALDRSQPEFVSPFMDYFQKRVDVQKVQKGRQLLAEHDAMLSRIEAEYGVSKYTLVAFWGMETQYGRSQGELDVLSSLATLSYDSRRTEFFRGQLLDAIRMIDIGHAQADSFTGSWAGAFGNMQFMPTTFMLYAVDGDSDGKVDVVNSLPDAFASAANYLSQVGWHSNEPAMLEVSLPENFDWKDAQFAVKKPLAEWSRLGVRAMHVDLGTPGFASKALSRDNLRGKYAKVHLNGKKQRPALHKPFRREQKNVVHTPVTRVGLDMLGLDIKGRAAILLPQGYRGPAFMVFENFDAIMDWNRSVNYALSVAQLAEQLRRESRIVGGQAAESGALSFDEMLDLQGILNALGFDAGEPDGLPGFKTQQAVREYQLANQLPADGYASRSVYQKLYSEQLQ